MNKLRRKVYMTAGYNTISLGTGRKEFNPKVPREGLEYYIKEAGQGTLKKIGGAKNVDEGAIVVLFPKGLTHAQQPFVGALCPEC